MFTALLLLACCLSSTISTPLDQGIHQKYVDGKQYTINNGDTKFIQRVSDQGTCTVELNNGDNTKATLVEGEIVKIKNKWFKIEDCRLNRAYMLSCGSPLFYQMHKFVCSYVEQLSTSRVLKQRHAENALTDFLNRSYYGECCKSACTISELLQYCPSKW